MRGADLAVLAGTAFDAVQDLTLADVTFGVDSGVSVSRLMMRPVKNATILRGKTFALVLAGGGSLIDPVETLRAHVAEADPNFTICDLAHATALAHSLKAAPRCSCKRMW